MKSLCAPYIIDIPTNLDIRGCLSSIEEKSDIPFEIKRIFYMHHVSQDRGGHAHINTDQVVIAISGSFSVNLFDGKQTHEFHLNDCTKGLYIPRLTYTDLIEFSPDAVCLVLASTHYDMGMSLRSLDDYLSYIKQLKI
jgi:hypothetical protein